MPGDVANLLRCYLSWPSQTLETLSLDNLLAFMQTHCLSVAGWLRGASPCIRCRNVKNTHDRMAHKERLAWDRQRLYGMLIVPFSSQSQDKPPCWCSAERNECLEDKGMHCLFFSSIALYCFAFFFLFSSLPYSLSSYSLRRAQSNVA